MSGGKGGSQSTTVSLPPEIEAAAKDNLALAKQVGRLPYAPYFGGSVAAFTPGQEAGFNNMNQAASAFGMQGGAGQGLPKPGNFGGISAYSTEEPYKAAMAKVDPGVKAMYDSFFAKPGGGSSGKMSGLAPGGGGGGGGDGTKKDPRAGEVWK